MAVAEVMAEALMMKRERIEGEGNAGIPVLTALCIQTSRLQYKFLLFL